MADYAVHAPVDVWFKAINKSIFLSKFFTIFSLLFGLSFFIQMDRAARRGQPFARRFAWRLALLFGIGLLHNGFFRGDILTVYALLGLLLIPFQKASNRVLLGTALAIVAGLPRYLLLGAKLLFFAPRTAAEQAAFETFNFQYFYLAREGGFAELFLRNLHPGWLMKMEFQFDLFGRGYLTFALFLFGLWLGRVRFFEWYGEKKKMVWQLFVAVVCLALATEPLRKALLAHYDLRSWRTAIGLTIQDIHNLAFSAALVLGFLLLTLMEKTRKLWFLLASYGRMALSHYVGQSILGGFFFFGWGLGLLGKIGAAQAFLLGQGIFLVQILFSRLWLHSFRYGPLEWLWRSGTYRKWQPLRKE